MNKNNKISHKKDISLQYIISIIVKRIWLIIFPVLLCILVSIILLFVLPKEYEASSLLLVKRKKVVEPLVSQLGVPADIREELKTLSKQILSWPMLEKLVDQLNLTRDIKSPKEYNKFIEKLKSKIQISLKSDEVIQISYLDQNPEKAQLIVNTITQNIIEENLRSKRLEMQNAIDFISEQLRIYREKLENSQRNFSTSKIDAELRVALNKQDLLKEKLKNLEKIIPSQVTKEQNPIIAKLNEQLAGYKMELARLLVDAKEGNPRVAELQNLISSIEKKIEAEKEKETLKESVSVINPVYLQTLEELKKVETEINYLQQRKEELIRNQSKSAKPVTEEELVMLERNKKIDEDIYQLLLKQLESAYMSERLLDTEKSSKFVVLEYARKPFEPSKPNKFKIIFLGLVVGLMLSFGLISLVEYLDQSFVSFEDAKNYLPLSILGTITKMVETKNNPESFWENFKKHLKKYKIFSMLDFVSSYEVRTTTKSKISPFLVTYHQPNSIVAEEYRILRTNLLRIASGKKVAIMFTSTLRGEGKSLTSANLAISISQISEKTLLIDCDLRRPTIHKIFGIDQQPGISDLLKNENLLSSILAKNVIDKLTIIPSGEFCENPAELLETEQFPRLLSRLKNIYDIIVIDTPPVFNLSDTHIIGKYVDFTVITVQMERTQRNDVLNTYNSLLQEGVKVAGFVLTKVNNYLPKYFYNYYYMTGGIYES